MGQEHGYCIHDLLYGKGEYIECAHVQPLLSKIDLSPVVIGFYVKLVRCGQPLPGGKVYCIVCRIEIIDPVPLTILDRHEFARPCPALQAVLVCAINQYIVHTTRRTTRREDIRARCAL